MQFSHSIPLRFLTFLLSTNKIFNNLFFEFLVHYFFSFNVYCAFVHLLLFKFVLFVFIHARFVRKRAKSAPNQLGPNQPGPKPSRRLANSDPEKLGPNQVGPSQVSLKPTRTKCEKSSSWYSRLENIQWKKITCMISLTLRFYNRHYSLPNLGVV